VYLNNAYPNAFVPALPHAQPSSLQRWLDIICRNDRLRESEALREFVESEVGFYPQSIGATARRRAVSLLPTVSGSSDTVEDIDFDFIDTKRRIEEFERNMAPCNKKCEVEINYRKGECFAGWHNHV
jgi:hypothetical protein